MTIVRGALLLVSLSIVYAAPDADTLGELGAVIGQALQFLEQCGANDLTVCLKERALRYLDTTSGNLKLAEGITLKEMHQEEKPDRNTSSLTLPDEPRARELAIDTLLMNRVAKFLSSHTLEFRMPKTTVAELRNLAGEEGRRKRKKMLLPLLLLLTLKAAAILPQALGAIALIAVKALVIGKVALIISGLIALKKLLESKHSSQTYEVVAHPHYTHSHVTSLADDHHGHYRRTLHPDAIQGLPYSAYVSD